MERVFNPLLRDSQSREMELINGEGLPPYQFES